MAGEMLGPILLSIHNLTYYQRLMADARQAISEDRFEAFRRDKLAFGATCRANPNRPRPEERVKKWGLAPSRLGFEAHLLGPRGACPLFFHKR